MNPIAMAALLLGLWGLFAWSAQHRMRLLKVGAPTWESRTDRLSDRLRATWTFALAQKKMRYYLLAGVAHQLIFLGFAVLLLRTLVLWGRGFDTGFNLWILGPEPVFGIPLGEIYGFVKDVFALLVIAGAVVFLYFRLIRREKRMSLSVEGIVILCIIMSMMLGDLVYDGATHVLAARVPHECAGAAASSWCGSAAELTRPLAMPRGEGGWLLWPDPGGSLVAQVLGGLGVGALVVTAHAGYWVHVTLVLVFLNLLPYSKHFHVITAIPNVFLGDLTPRGRLRPLAESTEKLMGLVEKASESEDMNAARIGYARIEHFTWKDVLDFYTCTECGRCSDNCPAFRTGKELSPKQFTLNLRDHLYGRRNELIDLGAEKKPVDLVPAVIHPEVLWACTTCRACEEQCPVNITYVDKIVQMRRHLVTIRGEFPQELAKPFEGMETNGNPWNLARSDRAAWAEGLELPTLAEKPTAETLFWVGCSASYDTRARKIARSTALLLKKAGVDFAILGEEECCTGDPARRAGNEYVFSTLAETNVGTLNGYKEQGGVKRIVTSCPHCFNTLKNEYGDFGGHYQVIHHSQLLSKLVNEGKLTPSHEISGKVVYHDACYLGRHNDEYDAPRNILGRIPGLEVVEVPHSNRKQGLCCGAGGAQMWMEEQNNDRMNVRRTRELVETGAQTLASACPYCMTMLTDGLKAESRDDITNQDVAELLATACGVAEARPASADSAAVAETESGHV